MKIGIIGGGQLAQMIAQAMKPLGIACICISETDNPPAMSDADIWYVDDNHPIESSLDKLAQQTDIITFDYEHVPDHWLSYLNEHHHTEPSIKAVQITKDRQLEKEFANSLAIPVGPFAIINQKEDAFHALEKVGMPCIIKSCRDGYDGKHQWLIENENQFNAFLNQTKDFHHIMEQKIPFKCEVSQCSVRNKNGDMLFYPLFRNEHQQGILAKTTCPDPDFANTVVEQQAQTICRTFAEALDYVGVFTIEFFVTEDNQLLLNEVAPRVHNSGHHTIESCQTSQFANHARAILDLPLGSTALVSPCTMQNIIGDMPALDTLLNDSNAHVHLYGKEPRPGRKLGHITYLK